MCGAGLQGMFGVSDLTALRSVVRKRRFVRWLPIAQVSGFDNWHTGFLGIAAVANKFIGMNGTAHRAKDVGGLGRLAERFPDSSPSAARSTRETIDTSYRIGAAMISKAFV